MSSGIQKLKIPVDQVREAGSLETTRSRVMTSSRTLREDTLIDDEFDLNRIPPVEGENSEFIKSKIDREKTRSQKVSSRRQKRIDQIKVIGNETSNRQQEEDDNSNKENSTVIPEPLKKKREHRKKKRDQDYDEMTAAKTQEKDINIGSISSDDDGVITYNHNAKSQPEKNPKERAHRPPVNNQFLNQSINLEVRETFNTLGFVEEKSKKDVEKLFQIGAVGDNNPTPVSPPQAGNNLSHSYFKNMGSMVFLFQKAPIDSMVRCTLCNNSSRFGRYEFELFLDGNAKLMLSAKSSTTVSNKINIFGRTADKQNAGYENVKTKLVQVEGKVTKKSFEIKRFVDSNESGKTKLCDVDFNSSLIPGSPKQKDIQIRLYDQEGEDNRSRVTYFDLVSKVPVYDKNSGIYKLDFKGRANKASVHNVQIIDASNEKNVLLQVGKIGTKQYILDFKEPFSIISAFGFAIALLVK